MNYRKRARVIAVAGLASMTCVGLALKLSSSHALGIQITVGNLSSEVRVESGDLVLAPPPAGLATVVTGEAAAGLAEQYEAPLQTPSGITAQLAVATDPYKTDYPVWFVTLKGICVSFIPGSEEASPSSTCDFTESNVLVDATDGSVMFAYSES